MAHGPPAGRFPRDQVPEFPADREAVNRSRARFHAPRPTVSPVSPNESPYALCGQDRPFRTISPIATTTSTPIAIAIAIAIAIPIAIPIPIPIPITMLWRERVRVRVKGAREANTPAGPRGPEVPRSIEFDCDCDTDYDPEADSDTDTGRTPHPPQPRRPLRPPVRFLLLFSSLLLRFCGFAQKHCLFAFAALRKSTAFSLCVFAKALPFRFCGFAQKHFFRFCGFAKALHPAQGRIAAAAQD